MWIHTTSDSDPGHTLLLCVLPYVFGCSVLLPTRIKRGWHIHLEKLVVKIT